VYLVKIISLLFAPEQIDHLTPVEIDHFLTDLN
jgi:hypothetical protein